MERQTDGQTNRVLSGCLLIREVGGGGICSSPGTLEEWIRKELLYIYFDFLSNTALHFSIMAQEGRWGW